MITDPATREFLQLFGTFPKMQDLTIENSRAGMSAAEATGARHPADIEDRTIPHSGKPGAEIFIRIVRPPGQTRPLPGLVYLHGGGWVLGDRTTHDRLIRDIVHHAQVVLFFVEYTRSPEVRFPYALEESYAASKWIAENASALVIRDLSVGGDSAGANMAAVLAQMCRERSGPRLRKQILLCPNTDATLSSRSVEEFRDGPFLTRADMEWFLEHYLGGVASPLDPMVSPLLTPPGQLTGLPPALVVTAEYDPVRDEGEQYAKKLQAAGVPVTAVRMLGTIHSFMYPKALAHTSATMTLLRLLAAQFAEAD
ncbi:MAG: alpha/beta hydrolase [Phycisphaerales bacterium]|nr:alpha/beta hydrolase [Planctomycetota bacterium]